MYIIQILYYVYNTNIFCAYAYNNYTYIKICLLDVRLRGLLPGAGNKRHVNRNNNNNNNFDTVDTAIAREPRVESRGALARRKSAVAGKKLQRGWAISGLMYRKSQPPAPAAVSLARGRNELSRRTQGRERPGKRSVSPSPSRRRLCSAPSSPSSSPPLSPVPGAYRRG